MKRATPFCSDNHTCSPAVWMLAWYFSFVAWQWPSMPLLSQAVPASSCHHATCRRGVSLSALCSNASFPCTSHLAELTVGEPTDRAMPLKPLHIRIIALQTPLCKHWSVAVSPGHACLGLVSALKKGAVLSDIDALQANLREVKQGLVAYSAAAEGTLRQVGNGTLVIRCILIGVFLSVWHFDTAVSGSKRCICKCRCCCVPVHNRCSRK